MGFSILLTIHITYISPTYHHLFCSLNESELHSIHQLHCAESSCISLHTWQSSPPSSEKTSLGLIAQPYEYLIVALRELCIERIRSVSWRKNWRCAGPSGPPNPIPRFETSGFTSGLVRVDLSMAWSSGAGADGEKTAS
jgi:hypothetical protein